MGEKAVFSTQAHVFQIDPQTKKRWLPASTSAVKVAFYRDPERKTYRIIAIESSKAVVNSTVTPTMIFTKTSPKFGQWTDHRANTVYGLGFSSERDLQQFVEKFSEAKLATKKVLEERKQEAKKEAASAPSPTSCLEVKTSQSESTSDARVEGEAGVEGARKASVGGMVNGGEHSAKANGSSNIEHSSSGGQDKQNDALKYENSRLKSALASSAQNVKRWENEMQTLKNNNAKLTTALKESNQHVAEWKEKLQQYKEDSEALKKKLAEMELEKRDRGDGRDEEVESLKKENEELKEVLSAVQLDLEGRERELEEKENSLQESNSLLASATEKTESLEEENQSLSARVSELEDAFKMAGVASQRKLEEARKGHTQLGQQLQDLLRLHQSLDCHYEL